MHPDLFRPEEQYPIELEEKPPKMPKLARVLLREAKKHEPADVARRATQIALRKQAKKEHPKRIRKLFGIGGGRRAVSLSEREAEVLAAAARGETPMFVELSSLTSAQIRELPRTAFTDEEWDQLDDDDREYIEENDTESKARVDDLADLFVSRYESERERGGGDDDNISEYFHDWLGQERDLYRLLPDRMYRGLVAYGDQNRVDETEVDAIINDYLSDPGRYELGDRRRGQNSVWSWDVEGSVYVSGDDIAQRIDAMTADEIERAVEKISKETGGDVDPSAADLKRLATATPRGYRRDYEGESFTTGQTVYATIDWDDVDTAVRELIDEAAPQPDEDDEDDEIDIDKIEISGKVPKLPRPAQPVVYEWPDGTTMVDLNIEDDEVVSITEALGILGVPWDTMSANKDALKPMIVKGKIRPHGRDTDGMPTFLRGELAFGLESLELRHCVGWSNMGYMDAVRNGEIKILSMRHADPAKRPIFTIEAVLAGRSMLGSKATRKITGIDQIKGFTNSVPGFARGEQEQVDTPEKIDRLTASKTEKILKDFRRDEVQKIIEWVINPPVQRGLGLDPSKIEDLRPALNVVELLADREDPWGVALQAKLDAANQRDATPPEPALAAQPLWVIHTRVGQFYRHALNEDRARAMFLDQYPDEEIVAIRRENPASSCEHGVCEGFCRPYRGRRNNPPLRRNQSVEHTIQVAMDAAEREQYGWFIEASEILGQVGARYLGRRNEEAPIAVAQCLRGLPTKDPRIQHWLYRIWGSTRLTAGPYVIVSQSMVLAGSFGIRDELAIFPADRDAKELPNLTWPIVLDEPDAPFGADRADFRDTPIDVAFSVVGITHVIACAKPKVTKRTTSRARRSRIPS